MQKTLRIKTTVLPGGRVEVVDQNLPEGEAVDVVITPSVTTPRRSALDILAEAPGHRLFRTAKEVDDYIKEERASWDR